MRYICIFVLFAVLTACSSVPAADAVENLPPGDAERGAVLFAESIGGAPACSTCHTLDSTTVVGPSFADYAATAPTRVEGVTAEAYTYTSIIHPAAHIVSGFGNIMYQQYEQRLTPQQIADLIAYLLTL